MSINRYTAHPCVHSFFIHPFTRLSILQFSWISHFFFFPPPFGQFIERMRTMTSPISSVAPPLSAVAPPLGNQQTCRPRPFGHTPILGPTPKMNGWMLINWVRLQSKCSSHLKAGLNWIKTDTKHKNILCTSMSSASYHLSEMDKHSVCDWNEKIARTTVWIWSSYTVERGHNRADKKMEISWNAEESNDGRKKTNKSDGPFSPAASGRLIVSLTATFCFLLRLALCFLACLSSRLTNACVTLVVRDVLCLFPHSVSKKRMCVFLAITLIFPTEEKSACLSTQLSKRPTLFGRIKDARAFISGPAWQQASLKPYLNVKLHRPPLLLLHHLLFLSFGFVFLTFCASVCCC